MEERFRKMIEEGDKLFNDRSSLHGFWQEVAINFYPEMASFTTHEGLGPDFAAGLSTSYPLLARRTLGDSFSALLRPVSLDTTSPGVWFGMRAERKENLDGSGRKWLEWATKTMRRAMYDRVAQFTRATKEGDHMFACFGQAPLSVQLNRDGDALLYQAWHLRDVVWTEGADGSINAIWRAWKPYAAQLLETFGKKVSAKVKEKVKNDPFAKIDCRHVVMTKERYEARNLGTTGRAPWISVWIDVDNEEVMEETPSQSKIYVIPRWVTVPGSQYASSPCVTAALPDGRLIQAMTMTLLQVSETFANPPLVATQEAVRSDVQFMPGGITWIDAEYDERLGEALRPLYQPQAGQGLSAAFQLRGDVREMISKAFYLDSLALPPADVRDMTAFEVGQRMSEWVRRAMPIFEPMEFEYNGQLCEETFGILLRNGAFGAVRDIPESLQGQNIDFKFESPLHESAERSKGQKFLEVKALLGQAAEVDPSVVSMLNARETLRDALNAIGTPAKWMRDDGEMDQMAAQAAELAQQQQMLEAAPQIADSVAKIGGAAKDFASAQQPPTQAAA